MFLEGILGQHVNILSLYVCGLAIQDYICYTVLVSCENSQSVLYGISVSFPFHCEGGIGPIRTK